MYPPRCRCVLWPCGVQPMQIPWATQTPVKGLGNTAPKTLRPAGETHFGCGPIPGIRSGIGSTVVHFFHGLMCSGETWRPMMAHAPPWTCCLSHNAPFRGVVVGSMDVVVAHSMGCLAAVQASVRGPVRPRPVYVWYLTHRQWLVVLVAPAMGLRPLAVWLLRVMRHAPRWLVSAAVRWLGHCPGWYPLPGTVLWSTVDMERCKPGQPPRRSSHMSTRCGQG